MSVFEVVPGSPGLTLHDVAHIVVPGAGRRANGNELSPASLDRVRQAAALYREQRFDLRAGRIVCSGYKSPGDTRGAPWSPAESPAESFLGMPEADLMRQALVSWGVDPTVVRVERHSVDTVTNFARAEGEGHFGDDRPVAIVSQRPHLERIIDIVAPRTLARDYLGVVARGPADPVPDGAVPRLVSRAILRGIRPDSTDIVAATHQRAIRFWAVVNVTVRLFHVRTRYQS